MVLFDLQVPGRVHDQLVARAELERLLQLDPVQVLLVRGVLDVNDPSDHAAVVVDDHPGVGHLAPHFGVEWCPIKDHFDVVSTWVGGFDVVPVNGQANYLGVGDFQVGVADVGTWLLESGPKIRLYPHPVVHVPGIAGPVLLFGHCRGKALVVHGQPFVGSIFFGQFNREAVGVVELEGGWPIDLVGASGLGFFDHFV